MSPPNWQLLLVTVNDRAAIFSEEFPATIAAAGSDVRAWFSHAQAHDLLYTFAGAWSTLGRDREVAVLERGCHELGTRRCRLVTEYAVPAERRCHCPELH